MPENTFDLIVLELMKQSTQSIPVAAKVASGGGISDLSRRRLGLSLQIQNPEQNAIKFHGFSTGLSCVFALRSARYCRLDFRGGSKSPVNQGFSGGRTRDRTLDLSRVKGTLSR
jgi:hypothetical protein